MIYIIFQVTVLGKADWERIQYQLNRRHIEAEERRRCQEERQKLHALSKERVKNWSNTLMVCAGFHFYFQHLNTYCFLSHYNAKFCYLVFIFKEMENHVWFTLNKATS